MKTLAVLGFTLLTLTITAVAQENPEALNPGSLIVLEKSWTKELPPARDTFRRNEELMRQTRREKEIIERRDTALPNQTVSEKLPPPPPPPAFVSQSRFAPLYTYKLKLQNNGAKTITKVYWEYQFLDPATQKLMGTRRIFSDMKLAPGKTKSIEAWSRTQPTIIVAAGQLDKKYQDQFTERLIIHRIHYADGTAWQRPGERK